MNSFNLKLNFILVYGESKNQLGQLCDSHQKDSNYISELSAQPSLRPLYPQNSKFSPAFISPVAPFDTDKKSLSYFFCKHDVGQQPGSTTLSLQLRLSPIVMPVLLKQEEFSLWPD